MKLTKEQQKEYEELSEICEKTKHFKLLSKEVQCISQLSRSELLARVKQKAQKELLRLEAAILQQKEHID